MSYCTTAQHSSEQNSTAQHSTAQCSISTAQCSISTAQQSQPSPAQHAQHSMHSAACKAQHAQRSMHSAACTAQHAQHRSLEAPGACSWHGPCLSGAAGPSRPSAVSLTAPHRLYSLARTAVLHASFIHSFFHFFTLSFHMCAFHRGRCIQA